MPRPVQGGVVVEHLPMQALQRLARVDAELVSQQSTQPVVAA
jgi:hypothetical protein